MSTDARSSLFSFREMALAPDFVTPPIRSLDRCCEGSCERFGQGGYPRCLGSLGACEACEAKAPLIDGRCLACRVPRLKVVVA